jgi:hypothetical protein
MKANKILPASMEAEDTFRQNLEGIKQSNSNLPDVSPDDKKGGKINDAIILLLSHSIENATHVENNLPRNFDLQAMVDNKAIFEANQSKITALEREIQRLKDANTFTGIQLSESYRIIYDAAKKSAKDDASLLPLRDKLGTPFMKTPTNNLKKEDKKPIPII